MEDGGVKNIVLIALVVVLSFVIGSLSADSLQNALIPIVVIVAVFTMLYLGRNSKYLIFYLPPVAGLFIVSLGYFYRDNFIIIAVFLYWLLMRVMNYIRFEWVGHVLLDSLVVLHFLYLCLSFYRHPVAVGVLGIDSDLIRGSDYIVGFLSIVSYIALSLIPFSCKELCKVVRNVAFLNLAVACIRIVMQILGKGGGEDAMAELGETAQSGRFTLFSELGRGVFLLVYALYPIRVILKSPLKIAALLLGVVTVLFGGWRSRLISFVFNTLVLSFFKRELTFMVGIGCFCYAGLLLLSSEHAFDGLPYGVQRSLCAIPGVHVSRRVESDANGSSEWRKEMWGWALDPRTNYIKDYVWGDGPGMSKSKLSRLRVAEMRGTANSADNEHFAEAGIWHSGWITHIHRYGIVGLVLAVALQLARVILSALACLRYRSTSYYPYLAVYVCGVFPGMILHHLSAGEPISIFAILSSLAIFKQLYVRARELDRDDSFFRSEPYTPLMIQDIREKEEQQGLVKV